MRCLSLPAPGGRVLRGRALSRGFPRCRRSRGRALSRGFPRCRRAEVGAPLLPLRPGVSRPPPLAAGPGRRPVGPSRPQPPEAAERSRVLGTRRRCPAPPGTAGEEVACDAFPSPAHWGGARSPPHAAFRAAERRRVLRARRRRVSAAKHGWGGGGMRCLSLPRLWGSPASERAPWLPASLPRRDEVVAARRRLALAHRGTRAPRPSS